MANLGVGAIRDRVVPVDGEPRVRPVCALSVSGDHSVLDGDTLGAFVSQVVTLLEEPLLIFEDLHLMVVGEFAESADLLVLGGGPGGYVAAIRAAQLGRRVTLVDEAGPEGLGGVCLQVGCIPSKALIELAATAERVRGMRDMGLEVEGARVSLERFQAWRERLCLGLARSVGRLLAAGDVTVVHGRARFNRPDRVAVRTADGQARFFEFEQAIVATGSRPVELPQPAVRRRARARLDGGAGPRRGAVEHGRRRRRLHRPRARDRLRQARYAGHGGRGARAGAADRRRIADGPGRPPAAGARGGPAPGHAPPSGSRAGSSWCATATASTPSRPSVS